MAGSGQGTAISPGVFVDGKQPGINFARAEREERLTENTVLDLRAGLNGAGIDEGS
jgi:hypothetical protein